MDENIVNAQENIIKIILANTISAMDISTTLCDHSSDNILKSDEVICGLIYRLMVPMTDNEINTAMESADSLMYGESSDEEEINEDIPQDEVVQEDPEDPDNISRNIRTNNCNCDICSKVRVCLINFKDYVPIDEMGDKFKESIISTCHTHNKIF